jgi:hypothetical protein
MNLTNFPLLNPDTPPIRTNMDTVLCPSCNKHHIVLHADQVFFCKCGSEFYVGKDGYLRVFLPEDDDLEI